MTHPTPFALALILLLTPVLVPSLGCNAFDADLLPTGPDPDPLCDEGDEQPPSRPGADDPGEDVADFWIALKDVRLDQSDNDDWSRIGYNLDDRCTTPSTISHDCRPLRDGSPVPVDGERGIDNTFGGELFPILTLAFPDLARLAIEGQDKGIGALMARVRGWNGQANDTSVEILISQSVFGAPGVGGAAPDANIVGFEGFDPVSGDQLPFPNWDGDDFFWIREDSFLLPGAPTLDEARPLIVDSNAYVSAGRLVATIPDGTEIVLVGEGMSTQVRLSDVAIVLDVVAMASGPRDEGNIVTIAGRWGYTDLLRTAETVGVCTDSPQFSLLDDQLRAITDVLLDPESAAEGAACDAVSMGVTFEAYFAQIAAVTPGQPLPDPCRTQGDMGAPDMGALDMGAPDMGAPDMGAPDMGGT